MLYPQLPRPASPYPFRNIRPFVTGGPIWAPQDRALTVFGLLAADLTYKGRSASDVMMLWKFYEDVDGAAGRFTYVDFNGIGVPPSGAHPGVLWLNLFVAQGDGTTAAWDAPTYAAHTASYFIGDIGYPGIPIVYENGTAKTTDVWVSGSTTPAAGHYFLVPGTGTDGVDKITAGTAPAAGVIITIDATCRRALRRAKFLADTNPFTLNVPTNYEQGTVTIQEVRK